MSKDGKSLEKLVAIIERALAIPNNIRVESPKLMRDRVTGRLREHDVVITIDTHHEETYLAIECRDRSRPVGVPDIEAFRKKCDNTGIHKRIIVSPRGFRKTALAHATMEDIRCLTIENAEQFDWIKATGFVLIEHEIHHTDWQFIIDKDETHDLGNIELFDIANTLLTKENLIPVATRELAVYVQNNNDEVDQKNVRINFSAKGIKAVDRTSKNEYKVIECYCIITYSLRKKIIPFQFQTYGVDKNGRSITNAAIAEIKGANIDGHFVIHSNVDGKKTWLSFAVNDFSSFHSRFMRLALMWQYNVEWVVQGG
jgi:hypothetical protein